MELRRWGTGGPAAENGPDGSQGEKTFGGAFEDASLLTAAGTTTSRQPISVLRRVGLRAKRRRRVSSSGRKQLESYLLEDRRHTSIVEGAGAGGPVVMDEGPARLNNGAVVERQPRVSIVEDGSPSRNDAQLPCQNNAAVDDGEQHDRDCACDRCARTSRTADVTISPLRAYATVVILFVVNLLNYVDRYTINGLLMEVKSYFDVDDTEMGMITTVFMVAYLACSPLFGYLGDRYTRRYIMATGVTIWVCAVLASTFVPPQHFWLFLLLRGVVGIGEVSYATVAPTLIADLFAADRRSQMLMLFYFAIPVGAGLGFVVGSFVGEKLADDWRWGLRVTPPLGVVAILLVLVLVPEPPRGRADEQANAGVRVPHTAKLGLRAMLHDWAYLARNYTFVFASLGFTGACFAIGSLSAWIAYTIQYAVQTGSPGEVISDDQKAQISLNVGVITMASGFAGVTCGQLWATRWRRTNVRADCLVCAISALTAVPFVYFGLTFARVALWFAYVCLFLAVTLLSFNWSVVPDIVMYVVTPTRRSMATAIETTMSHLLGDAFSPLLVGAVSDLIRGRSLSSGAHFVSLQYALYIPNMVLCLAAFFFFVAALYVADDKRRALLDTQASLDPDETLDSGRPAVTASSATLLQRSTGALPDAHAEDNAAYSNRSFVADGQRRHRPDTVG